MMFTTLRRWFQKPKTPYIRPENRFRRGLRVEQLEDRVVPASISVNPLDVAPGSTATFTGTGFEIGENVNISIVADNGNSEAFSVTDGGANDLDGVADGNFTSAWLCDPNGAYFAATLTATATGDLGSSASTTFTDAGGASAKPGTPDLVDASDTFASNTLNTQKSGSNNDDVTKNTSVTITVHGNSVGATITLFQGATNLGNLTVDPSTKDATFNVTLAAGSNTFTATQLEVGKTASAVSDTLTVTLDTTKPGAPTITSLQDDSGFGTADNVTSDNTPGINLGSISSPGLTKIYSDGVLVGAENHSSGTTQSVGITTALSDGVHVITATQLDSAGNESVVSAGFTIVVDTAAPVATTPTVTINSPGPGQVTISGSVNVATDNPSLPATTGTSLSVPAASRLRLFVDGVQVPGPAGVQITTTGAYSFTYTPTAGPHTYAVEHEDRAGNSVGLSGGISANVVTTELVALSLVAVDAPYSASPYVGVTLTGPSASPVAPVGTTTTTFYSTLADATAQTNGFTAPTNVGTYYVRAHFASSNLAQWTDADSNIASFTITQVSSTTTNVGVPSGAASTGSAQGISSATVTGVGLTTVADNTTYYSTYISPGNPGNVALLGAPVNAGTYTVVSTYNGDINHTGSSDTDVFTIAQVSSTTTNVGVPAGAVYTGSARGISSATVAGVGLTTVADNTTYYSTYISPGNPGNVALLGAPVNAGTYTVVSTYNGDINHTGSSDTDVFTIAQANLTINVGPASKIFNAAPTDLAATLGTTVDGVNGEKLSIAYSSAHNTVGAVAGVYTNDIAGALSDGTGLLSNYHVTVNKGTFTVKTGLAAGTQIHDTLFLLLANSDDIGTYFDVTVQMLDSNGVVIAQGQIDRDKLTFVNNNMTNTSQTWSTDVVLTVIGDTAMSAGSNFSFRILSKIDEGTGHTSGTAEIQYDAAIRSSLLQVDFGSGLKTYYLHSNNVMDTTNNNGDNTIDVNKTLNTKALAYGYGYTVDTDGTYRVNTTLSAVKLADAFELLGYWTGVVS